VKNKKFINVSFLFWLTQIIFGGIVSGAFSFFTKLTLEKWRKNKKSD
jgi:hypothetical protein